MYQHRTKQIYQDYVHRLLVCISAYNTRCLTRKKRKIQVLNTIKIDFEVEPSTLLVWQ